MLQKCEVINITEVGMYAPLKNILIGTDWFFQDTKEGRGNAPEMAILTPVMFKGVSSSPKTQAETVMVATSFAIPAIDMGTTPMRWMILFESSHCAQVDAFRMWVAAIVEGFRRVWWWCRARTRPHIGKAVCDASRGRSVIKCVEPYRMRDEGHTRHRQSYAHDMLRLTVTVIRVTRARGKRAEQK